MIKNKTPWMSIPSSTHSSTADALNSEPFYGTSSKSSQKRRRQVRCKEETLTTLIKEVGTTATDDLEKAKAAKA